MRGQSIQYEENDYVVLLVGDSQVEAVTGLKNDARRAVRKIIKFSVCAARKSISISGILLESESAAISVATVF